jgi:hypothetical protein
MHTMSDAILDQIKAQAFQEGVQYALEYLSDLYDGVMDTDLAAEYMSEGE